MFYGPDEIVAPSAPLLPAICLRASLPTAHVPAGRWLGRGRADAVDGCGVDASDLPGWVSGRAGTRGSGEGPLCSGERFDGNLLSPFVDRSHLPPQRTHPTPSNTLYPPPAAPPPLHYDWPHGAPGASMPPLGVDQVSLLLFC